MKTVIVTGAGGLVGSETVQFFVERGYRVVGIENDSRRYFFGEEASTKSELEMLEGDFANFKNEWIDVRDYAGLTRIFATYGSDIEIVIHTAAQPSHDWAAREPLTDFGINANGTLNLLEATRSYSPDAIFIFTSTNKVYGDTPNSLPLVEQESRWEVDSSHPYFHRGIDETMSVDRCKHSLFGVSKLAADAMVQEYGRYFGMKTAVFRGGCLTGPKHAGAELHGFLSYMMKCNITKKEYRIFGYKGKQVRDNIHSRDLVRAFYEFTRNPKRGEVYNIGGSRYSNCSLLEAITMCERLTGNKMRVQYVESSRVGDHIWWISDVAKFRSHFPGWSLTLNIPSILEEIYSSNHSKWVASA